MKNSIIMLNNNEIGTVSGGVILEGAVLALSIAGPFVGLAVGVIIFMAITKTRKHQ